MTEEEKQCYYDLALRFVGIQADKCTVEMIWRMFEDIQKKKGEFTLRDYAAIKAEVVQKHQKLAQITVTTYKKDGKTTKSRKK